jgi:hypothetical protein
LNEFGENRRKEEREKMEIRPGVKRETEKSTEISTEEARASREREMPWEGRESRGW